MKCYLQVRQKNNLKCSVVTRVECLFQNNASVYESGETTHRKLYNACLSSLSMSVETGSYTPGSADTSHTKRSWHDNVFTWPRGNTINGCWKLVT